MGDDIFRLDLADHDKEYIQEVFDGFLEGACRYGRKLTEIRLTQMMLDRLQIEQSESSFKGVPVIVCDTGFEGTIEVVLCPLH